MAAAKALPRTDRLPAPAFHHPVLTSCCYRHGRRRVRHLACPGHRYAMHLMPIISLGRPRCGVLLDFDGG
jgi:hypothetical protein